MESALAVTTDWAYLIAGLPVEEVGQGRAMTRSRGS